jgi:predicted amidohydrolase
MFRKLVVEQNVGVFVVSSAWPFPRVEHFRTLALARAIENQSYVVASNRVGKDDDLWFCGSSAIIDPRGIVVASASADREELIQADLSEDLVLSVRSRVQSLAHRRQDLYR